jgi:Tol biopolymer transport system component
MKPGATHMPASFEWEIQDDAHATRQRVGGTPPPHQSRRRLRWGTALLILLIVLGFGIRAWVTSRLETADRIEQALRAAVELELKAIADGDAELFIARQDPTDSEWRIRQITRYISARVPFAPAPHLVPADRPAEIRQVQLTRDIARVDLVHWFQPGPQLTRPQGVPISVSQPLPFHSSWFYRQADDGKWVHVAPPDDYVGIPHAWHGIWLSVHATEVEAELFDSVAGELARLVSRACQLVFCPGDVHYILSLENTVQPGIRDARWALPALYLTGLPGDAAARDAWLQAIKPWLVEVLLQSRVQDEQMAERVIYGALVTRLQAHLGLTAPTQPGIELLRQALRERKQHSAEELWRATYNPDDPAESRLLEAEATALLDLIADQAGVEQVFALLPALTVHDRFSPALRSFTGIEHAAFTLAWTAYLSELTGVTVPLPQPILQPVPLPDAALPPLPTPPSQGEQVPGDHLAFICAGQIWTSRADGSQLAPLTASGQRFAYLQWSPDGRWLLTTWQPDIRGAPSVLYLLAADGSGGRPLTDDVAAHILPIGWSPDGRDVIYAIWHRTATFPMEIQALNVETGATRRLPGVPSWSPDGTHLSYVTDPFGSAWLASGDWENPRPIADRAWAIWHGGNWSPDSTQVALQVDDVNRAQSAITVFDVERADLETLITSSELTTAFISFGGAFIGDGTELSLLADKPLRWLWPFGWSATGEHLLLWVHRSERTGGSQSPSAVAAIPLDGSAPRLLAYGTGSLLGRPGWSPSDPERLVFTWSNSGSEDEVATTFLYHLQAGPILALADSRDPTWSPDGAWVALSAGGQVAVVDQAGQERFTFAPEKDVACTNPTWNPAADLDALKAGSL